MWELSKGENRRHPASSAKGTGRAQRTAAARLAPALHFAQIVCNLPRPFPALVESPLAHFDASSAPLEPNLRSAGNARIDSGRASPVVLLRGRLAGMARFVVFQPEMLSRKLGRLFDKVFAGRLDFHEIRMEVCRPPSRRPPTTTPPTAPITAIHAPSIDQVYKQAGEMSLLATRDDRHRSARGGSPRALARTVKEHK